MNLFSVKRSWFHTFRNWLSRPTRNINRQLNRRVLQIDVLEERLTPATGSFNSTTGTITFNYTATGSTGESVVLTNNGSTISATGNVTGTTSFTTSTVKAVLITASGNSTGQSLTFAGTASYSLSSGISISGIDSVAVNATINTAASNILMTLGNGIAINSPITTTTGNITIYANNGATSSIGDFYGIHASANVTTSGGNIDWTGRGGTTAVGVLKIGILIDNGSTISAGSTGYINLTGTGGASAGVYNHGISVVGKNSARSTVVKTAGGNITLNGKGGGVASGGGNNYGVSVSLGGVVSSGGTGTVTVNGTGGFVANSYGLFLDADTTSLNDTTFIASNGGKISITAAGGGSGTGPIYLRGRSQIGTFSNYTSLASVNYDISIDLVPGPSGTLGFYNEMSTGKIISGTGNITITSDYFSYIGATALISSGQLTLQQKTTGFYQPFTMSSFVTGFQVNPSGNGMADLSKGLIVGKSDNNSEVSLDAQLTVGGSITINSLFSTVSKAVTSVTGSVNISALQAIAVSAPITTGSGDIILTANNGASPVSGDFYGVRVSANVTTTGGNIQLTGRGGDSSTGKKHGVFIDNAATIKATVSGSININGIGGANIGTQNRGVYLTGGSKVTTTGTGGISIFGTAGSGSGNGNAGVFIEAASIVSASGTGNVLLTAIGGSGAGSSNYGLYFTGSGSSIFSAGTLVSIEASGNSNSEAIQLVDGANLEVATGGEIRLTADSVGLLGLTPATVIASGGIVNIRNRAIGTIIDLGGTDGLSTSPLKLGLTDTELDCFNAATITIGRTDSLASGSISLSASITRSLKTNFTLQTGQNINITGGMLDSSGGKIVLSTPATGAVSATKSGIDITSSSVIFTNGSRLNIDISGTVLDASYDQLNLSGSLDLAGTSLVLSGSIDIELGNVLTIVSATLITGQFADLLENAVISQAGRDFRINYFSNSVTLTLVRAPTITSSNSKSSIYGSSTSLQVTSTGFPLTFIYSLQGTVPAGVSIGTNTGLLSVSPSTTVGSYSFSVIVSNGVGTPASEILSLSIGRKTLTVTADDKSKNYDGLAFTSFTSSISGFVNSETVANITVGNISYIGSAVLATNSGTSIITPVLSGFSADNYAFEIAAGTLTINKAALTLKADNKSKTYNGSVFSAYTYAYTGFVNGETVAAITPGTVTYTGTAIAANTAGSYVITPAVSGFSATNYNTPILVDGTLTINKAALTLTADNKAKTYDGSVFSSYTYAYAGFVNNESESDITPGTITYAGTAVPATAAGSYVITPAISGFAATNYNIPNLVDGILTINKATLTVTPDAKTKTYDGLVFTAFTNTITGYVNSETSSVINGAATYSGTATSATAAGTYATINAVVSGMSANNYNIVSGAAGTLTINKATLTVTPDSKTKTYDGLVFTAFTNTITGYVNSETSSVITGSATYSGTATSATAAGTYATINAVVSGMSASNYTIVAGAAGTLTINKATLTVTSDAKAKTYDGLVFTGFTSTISGYVNSETSSVVTGSATYSGAAISATAAGTYASITAVVSNMSASNYTIVAGPAGILTINKAVLTLTAANKTKTYDGSPFSGYSYAYSGFVNGESVSAITQGTINYTGTATTAMAVGTYVITPNTSGFAANNYSAPNLVSGTLSISKATLTVIADNKTKNYDGQTFNLFTSAFSGFVNGETASVVTGAAGFGGLGTTAKDVGTYTISPQLNTLNSSNYVFAFLDGTLTINKTTLTVTADNKSKIYDGTVFTNYTSTISGFVNGENASVVTGITLYSSIGMTTAAAGSYTITPVISGLSSNNYLFLAANGNLTINKATLTVTADSKTKTYDDQLFTVFTSSFTGFVNNENSSVVAGAPAYTGSTLSARSAGSYTITPTLNNLTASNYTFAFQDGTLTINKAMLTVTADNTTKTYNGQALTVFTSTISGFVNSENVSVVSGLVTYTGNALIGINAGSYVVTPLVADLSATNYAFSPANGTLIISKATLTVSADNKEKVQDNQIFSGYTSTISGFMGSDTTSTVNGTVTRFTGNAITATKAGSYVISPDISGLSALNYDFVKLDGILTINNPLAVAPDISWQTIAAITYGVPLSATQLNPAASVPGTFTFSPGAGVLLGAGTITITALFTPSDLLFYKSVTVTNTIVVNKATLTVLADNKTTTYSGHAFNAFTSTITGFVNGDNTSVISGAPAFSGEAATASGAGTHAIALSTGTLVAANYSFSFLPGTLTINKATLTVTADNRSKTYDGVASTGFSSSYTGFVNGENGSVVSGTAGFGGTAIGAVTAGSYTIIVTPGTLSAANYNLVFQAGTLTINKALLSVTADNKTKTYDGLTFSAFTSVISGFVGTEDLSAVSGSIGYLGAAVSATGTGNYTILPTSGTLSAANYAFTFSSGVLSIGKATLSVLADNKSKTYNGQVFTGFTYTLSGFVNGEGSSLVNGSLAFGGDARAATNAGDYQIIPTLGTLTAVNYAFNFLPGTLTINKAVLTVTADNKSKTYDGQPSTGFTASYTGFANSENASVISGAPGFSGTAIGVVAAGNYPINPTPGNITAPNYDFAFQAGTLIIKKALLTVTADNKTKTYDGQVFTAFSSVINGFVNNEDLSAVSGSTGYIGAATSATATGTYPILPTTGSLSAANYAFAFSQGALTIGKATLTVSADNKIKIYDGQVFSAFTYTLTGFANGDGPNLVTGSSSIGGNARSAINAGDYQIVPTVGTLSASNYTFTFAPGILTISKAILFVTAGNFTKTYDGLALNGFTSAITGFVNGENMSVVSGNPGYSGTGATASVAGSHALSPTVGTLAAANYTFALQDGLVTINRAPLMVTADSITKTYNGQIFTSFTTSFNGFVNAENAIVVTGTASFSGSAMSATQAGQYEITVTLGTLSASNYVLSFTPGTLTINKALLTLTADNKSKTYDGLGFSAFSATVSGFVNGETPAVVLTGNPLFKGPATTATQKGQYLIVPEAGTLHAANYRFATFVTGSLDILRSGPMVTGAQTANFIVNQMLAIPAFRVSDPDSGLLGILDITVTTTRGKITIGSNTAQSITFANTILSANQMLAKIKYTTATDSFLNATISVTAQDRDAAGAVVGSWTTTLAPSAGIFAKIQDPSKPGKTSLVVQGSVKNESIVVKPVSASNLTSYTVSMTGMATQVITGITGRILAYASGGDDTINMSAVKISTLLSGGEGNDIILGGSVADTIFGNGGNDLIIGGLGSDIINGDYGNDILVDGSVVLKSKTDTLDKVLATWNSLPAPTTSIYNNITARLSTVFDKYNVDTMGGGNGIDWFWSTTTGAVADTIGIFTGEKRRTI